MPIYYNDIQYRQMKNGLAYSVKKYASQANETPTDCLMFLGEEGDFTLTAKNVTWDGTVEYSTDKSTWSTWDGTAISSVEQKLYLRGYDNTGFYTNKSVIFSLSGLAGCYGNINTLLQYDNPPTTLGWYCYMGMFHGCTNLTHAPDLPATTLADCCYGDMFYNCSNLIKAPELPATELAKGCYSRMFYGCRNLIQAPELPATTLAQSCYCEMFMNCVSLKLSETQTDEYTQPYRIPASGAGTTASYALDDMFIYTGGTFVGTPEINTVYYLHNSCSIV